MTRAAVQYNLMRHERAGLRAQKSGLTQQEEADYGAQMDAFWQDMTPKEQQAAETSLTVPHKIRTEEEKLRLAQEVITYLNEVVALDPDAIHNLCEHRVQVNDLLAGHDTTQAGVLKDGGYSAANPTQDVLGVGMLGILNGLVGVRSDHWGYITAVYGDDGKLQRFQLTKREHDGPNHPDVGDRPVADVEASMIINGHRRRFVEGIQYYLNELLEDDSPLHVIGHIDSYCRDYEKLIRDALKVYGTGATPPPTSSGRHSGQCDWP